MLQLTLAAVMVACASLSALPEYLQPLAPMWENEEALTEALRAFDKANTARIDAIVESVQNPAAAGDPPPSREQAEAEIKMLLAQVREAYELALVQHSDSARLHNYYGELLYDRYGDHAGALRQWHLALSYDEKLAGAYNNLALHHFHVGEYETGLRNLDAALKHDKKNPDYLFNMVNIYLVHGPQISEIRGWKNDRLFKEAMKLSEKAMKYAPGDYDIVQDYAVNFYAAENFGVKSDWGDAAEAWQAARNLARNDDERFYCWLNEGRVWLRNEAPDKAIPCLEEALRIHPDSAPARQLLDSIREPQPAEESAPVTEQAPAANNPTGPQ